MIKIKKARCDNERKRTCCLEQGAGTLRREGENGRGEGEGRGTTEHSTIFLCFSYIGANVTGSEVKGSEGSQKTRSDGPV